MGTNIVSGTSTAIVLATGGNTYFGSMAKSLYSVSEKNSFEKGKRKLITKGSVDEITSICSYIDIDGKAYKLTEDLRKKAYDVYENN